MDITGLNPVSDTTYPITRYFELVPYTRSRLRVSIAVSRSWQCQSTLTRLRNQHSGLTMVHITIGIYVSKVSFGVPGGPLVVIEFDMLGVSSAPGRSGRRAMTKRGGPDSVVGDNPSELVEFQVTRSLFSLSQHFQ